MLSEIVQSRSELVRFAGIRVELLPSGGDLRLTWVIDTRLLPHRTSNRETDFNRVRQVANEHELGMRLRWYGTVGWLLASRHFQ